MRLVAIDPGWRACGACAVEGARLASWAEYYAPSPPRGISKTDERVWLGDRLSEWLREQMYGADVVVVEAFNKLRGRKAAFSMGMAYALAIANANALGIPSVAMDAQAVKLELCGRRNASKDECWGKAVHELDLGPMPNLPHARDAIALAVASRTLPLVKGLLRAEANYS